MTAPRHDVVLSGDWLNHSSELRIRLYSVLHSGSILSQRAGKPDSCLRPEHHAALVHYRQDRHPGPALGDFGLRVPWHLDKDMKWYRPKFAGGTTEHLIGEGTPNNMCLGGEQGRVPAWSFNVRASTRRIPVVNRLSDSLKTPGSAYPAMSSDIGSSLLKRFQENNRALASGRAGTALSGISKATTGRFPIKLVPRVNSQRQFRAYQACQDLREAYCRFGLLVES